MSWELKPAGRHFSTFAPEWDRLNARLYNSHPLFDSRFIGPLLEYFGSGDELLCVHRSSDAIDGALILHPAGLGRWKLFLPSQAQIGAVLLHDPKSLETLFPALPGHAWTIDLLAQDPGFTPAWTGLNLPRRQLRHALTMAVTVKGSFGDYWQARHKQLRKNLRRYQQRTAERHPQQRFAVIDAPDQITDAVTRFGQLESAGWKGREGTAVSPDNPQGRFYAQLLHDYAQTGQASVIEFWLGEQLAASRLLICHQGMWIILKTTYDESLAALAPGRQLLHEVLSQAFASLKSGTVEFYTNATQDQAEWATDLRFIHHHQIYRNRTAANLHLLLRALSPRPGNPGDNIAFDPSKIAGYTSIDALPEDAINLLEDAAKDNIETSPEWFANLQTTVFPDDPGVRYYVKSFESTSAAVLPVLQVKRGVIRQIEALGNFYTSLYTPLAPPSGDLSLLLREASRDHGQAHVMRFAPMDPATPAFASMISALFSIGWIPFRFFCFGNWYQPITGTWQDYLNQRDGQLRSTLKRKGRKFTTDGGNLEIVTTPDQVEKAIAAFTQVYAQSWKKPEPYTAFVPGLIRWLAAKGHLRLGIAWLNGQPIAAQLWIVNASKASIFKLAHDAAYAQYAPGTLLTAHLMEHVIDRDKVQEVDYLVGDDEHKKLWMNHRRERWGIVAYNPTSLIGIALLLQEAVGKAIRKFMNNALFGKLHAYRKRNQKIDTED